MNVLGVHSTPLLGGLVHDALLGTRDLPAPLLPRLRQGSQVRLPYLVVLYFLWGIKRSVSRVYKTSKEAVNKEERYNLGT